MASVTRSALRVRKSKPRSTSSAVRRIVLKALTGGVAVLAIVFMVMIGAGWLLAVSLQARSDIQSIAAGPPARPAWIALPAGGMAGQAAMVASLSGPETKRSSEVRGLDPIGALALVIPESFDGPAHTGSIATKFPEPAALNVASAGLSRSLQDLRSTSCFAPATLAALGPVQNSDQGGEEARTAIYDITPRPCTCRVAAARSPFWLWQV